MRYKQSVKPQPLVMLITALAMPSLSYHRLTTRILVFCLFFDILAPTRFYYFFFVFMISVCGDDKNKASYTGRLL